MSNVLRPAGPAACRLADQFVRRFTLGFRLRSTYNRLRVITTSAESLVFRCQALASQQASNTANGVIDACAIDCLNLSMFTRRIGIWAVLGIDVRTVLMKYEMRCKVHVHVAPAGFWVPLRPSWMLLRFCFAALWCWKPKNNIATVSICYSWPCEVFRLLISKCSVQTAYVNHPTTSGCYHHCIEERVRYLPAFCLDAVKDARAYVATSVQYEWAEPFTYS